MADAPLILVLDEGTSSTRAVVYSVDGALLGSSSRAIEQHYPAPGLVEHDAEEIWQATLACGRDVPHFRGLPGRRASLGSHQEVTCDAPTSFRIAPPP